ncbi:MAG: glucose-6-phosphate dehydrogenase [Rubricoccaceae bacterium]
MDPHLFVLFGATGDLARAKLVPALYHLTRRGDAPPSLVVLGTGRTDWDDARFRTMAAEALAEKGVPEADARAWAEATLHYVRADLTQSADPLTERIVALEAAHETGSNRVYYLALPPAAFSTTAEALGAFEARGERAGWTRLVVEKPFGSDLASARALNETLHACFDEAQVFRIDHFLGKETVQNLLVFRFANALFEAAWTRAQVERVEITVAETNDAEGRTGYFEDAGTMRDMIQNHLMQLYALTAMEPPARLDAEGIRAEKIKVLRSTRPADPSEAVYGQYGAGDDPEGGRGEAYRDHEGVAEHSQTETFAAVTLRCENWRWQGVPFVLRTGKRLRERLTEIAVVFRRPPVRLFHAVSPCQPSRNVLRIRLQPDEGFRLSFDVKAPGDGFPVSTQHFRFSYADAFGPTPDAYETLLRDVALGDPTLFVHAEEAEEAWRVVAPLIASPPQPEIYSSGSWGPEAARALVTVAPA